MRPFSTLPHTRHGPVFSAAILAHCFRDATCRRYGFRGRRAGFGFGRAGPSSGIGGTPVAVLVIRGLLAVSLGFVVRLRLGPII
jgi:hypothetical protein